MNEDPREEYRRRLQARRADSARQDRLHRMIGNTRLGVFLAGSVLAWLSFQSQLISPWWLVLPGGIFLVLIVLHERVLRARRRFERGTAFYDRGLGRLEDRWAGAGEQGARFLGDSHLYAEDLDLFGKGSLFELLCTARTRAGEDTLAAWLRASAGAEDIRARQAAVSELRPRLDLREELSLLGADVGSGVDPEALSAWVAAPPVRVPRFAHMAVTLLSLLAVVVLVLWVIELLKALTLIPPPDPSGLTSRFHWLLLVTLFEGALALPLRARIKSILSAVERPGRDLKLLSQVLGRLEREQFDSPRLAALRAALESEGLPPSRQIRRLDRLIVLLDSRRNLFFAPLAALLFWGTQCALAIEHWRQTSGPAVGRWLKAVGEIEALCSLAGYAYEHPADPFPEISEGTGIFEGEGMGHPLLAEERCVRNDLRLGDPERVLIVSGSNMSGKSTLLRTVGTNAVLAMTGAPVRARRLRLTPLAIGASIRIQDSLQAGSSRFYAEITRIRGIVEVTNGPFRLLFLLDELLHGTNSHDRRIGAQGVVRALIDRGAIGLITTHDLALAHIADVLAPRAANVHFEDYLEDGKIRFDYRVRPGVVERSNALELMRSVGLDV
jgi:hypothetical protein